MKCQTIRYIFDFLERPPRVARKIKAKSLISFCEIFEKFVECFFVQIQNSYGKDGAHGDIAINPSV